jgi:hypothetical protein
MVMYLIFVHLIPSGGVVFMQHVHNGRIRSEGNILFMNSFVNTQAMGVGDMQMF